MLKKYLLENCEFIESSNFDDRPKNIEIDSIIIHCISLPESEFNNDNVINLFLNKLNYKCSSIFHITKKRQSLITFIHQKNWRNNSICSI